MDNFEQGRVAKGNFISAQDWRILTIFQRTIMCPSHGYLLQNCHLPILRNYKIQKLSAWQWGNKANKNTSGKISFNFPCWILCSWMKGQPLSRQWEWHWIFPKGIGSTLLNSSGQWDEHPKVSSWCNFYKLLGYCLILS